MPQVAGKYASFLSCTFTLNVAQVLDCRTLPDGFYVCGGGGGIYLGSRVTEPLTIASTVFTRNTGMYGGALQITAGPESTVSNCTFEHNNGVQGGGLYVAGGVSILTLTTLKNNDCKAEGAYAIDDCGKNVQPVSGILLYLLPVPAGHWLPNADCVVNRIGCPLGDKLCSDTRAACSLTAGQVASGRTAHHARRTLARPPCLSLLAPSPALARLSPHTPSPALSPRVWQAPVVPYVRADGNTTNYTCRSPISIQPCAWEANPDFLGQKVRFTPYFAINLPFPNECAAGFLGSSDVASQTSSDCAGRCPSGYYCPTTVTLDPTPCPKGYFCEAGSTTPRPCPAGTYSNASIERMSSASQCVECPAGSSCTVGSREARSCDAGTYNALAGRERCEVCVPGKYQDVSGQTACKACNGGYCPLGSKNPTSCEVGGGLKSSVAFVDGESPEDCVCKAGFYDNATTGLVQCLECPSGTNCMLAGTTLSTLPVKPGYYRLSRTSIDVRRCPDAAKNCSEASECEHSSSACRGITQDAGRGASGRGRRRLVQADDVYDWRVAEALGCAPGLAGPFCQLCADAASANASNRTDEHIYYKPSTSSAVATCEECGATLWDTAVFCALVGAAAALTLGLVAAVYKYGVSVARKAQLAYAMGKFNPGVKLKILIAFYQIATKVDEVYSVRLPAGVKQLLNSFASLASLGITVEGVSTPLACLGSTSYVDILQFWMVMPVVLVGFVVVIALMVLLVKRRRCTGDSLLGLALPWVLRLLFLVYPVVTKIAFDAFPCHEFAGGEQFLKADVAVECTSAYYKEDVLGLAWAAIYIYPVGLVVLNALLLGCARKAIMNKRPTTLSEATAFLHKEYEPHVFWWELVEMLRRFVLIGLMIVVFEGRMLQLILGTILTAILLFFQVQTMPFNDLADDYLAAAASFSLLIIFLCWYTPPPSSHTPSPSVSLRARLPARRLSASASSTRH